ncbi:MAG: aldo/keto reductase [Treponema sp.]|nr:aldo/keto reductase [Treponema sp.]
MKKEFTLSNGIKIPAVGYGSYLSTENGKQVIKDALDSGYRYIDTARFYNNEDEIGEALEEYRLEHGLERREIFLVSKVWPLNLGRKKTLESFEASLKSLGTDYLDMYLIHWPKAHQNDPGQTELMLESWQMMEDLYKNGKIKAIGLSNFLPHHIRPLLENARVKPMLDQLELHVGYMQEFAVDYLRKENIVVQAWSPLGRKRVLNDERILPLAEKYGKSPAQVLLHYLLQRNICVIPKASSVERMKENLDVFDFELTEDEISYLSCIPQEGWSGEHPDLMNV